MCVRERKRKRGVGNDVDMFLTSKLVVQQQGRNVSTKCFSNVGHCSRNKNNDDARYGVLN